MITRVSKFRALLSALLVLPIGVGGYLYSKQSSSKAATPITINSNVSIPVQLLDEATLESELGLALKKRNTKANRHWEQVVKSGGIFDCLRPLGEYEFNSGQWVTPSVVTYRNVNGEHLLSFVVELFHSHHEGKFTFEGALKENLTLDYSAEGLSAPLNYFSREPKVKRGNCVVPVLKSAMLPPLSYNPNRYHSRLVNYYMDVIEPIILSFKEKIKREIQ
ncbi:MULTISPECIES: hypothetical protein [Pseudoalteromonas]|uniref:hypothetical protein n=1 Tax=Pseudoalteromonas TaxID=53246 RepID=UPI001581C61E|nr:MULTISPECIES: hypothetical protein [Pseudoalteromonas]MDI4652618.1 hypothetical protein [Pseudoalteromonas shioyasakiensis]NUJ38673.1 hypothetical protein [Pseudoalteromonas sp. 0303]